jgi:hypothetical protein
MGYIGAVLKRENDMGFDWISWDTSTREEGGGARQAKAHAEDQGRTLCGLTVPEQGNGVEVGAASDYADGTCKRCEKIVGARVEPENAWDRQQREDKYGYEGRNF